MPTQEERSIGVISVHKKLNSEFLFCLVRESDGHWGFPKGHQDDGESDEETARRELREETGIAEVEIDTTRTFEEQYSFERGGGRVHKQATYFLGRVHSVESATPPAFKAEIPEVRWLSYAEAKETLTFPEAKRLLEDVWEYLNKRLE